MVLCPQRDGNWRLAMLLQQDGGSSPPI